VQSLSPYQELAASNVLQRVRVSIHGAVQGVGFRPFVYRLAIDLGLTRWVSNSSQGVAIEAEGELSRIADFLHRLEVQKPPRASIQGLEYWQLDPVGYERFEIRPSEAEGEKTALVLPDIATCGDCLAEILDPADRRCSYPFTNCTNCGPRFSIIEALPYDRANTTMRALPLGASACVIGRVVGEPPGLVTTKSRIGITRIVQMLSGEQLPRIC